MGREDDLLGVQRARPDVAVDDAEGAKCEHGLAGVGDYVPLGVLQRFEALANGLRVLFLIASAVSLGGVLLSMLDRGEDGGRGDPETITTLCAREILPTNAPLVAGRLCGDLGSRSKLVGLALRPDHFSSVPATSLAGSSLFLPCDPLQRARKV